MPRVSVVIPSYNHQQFIAETIESVLAQTYQDFEVVITDDGSTDGTADVIRRFTDPRVKLSCFPENRGAVIAVNTCIADSSGEFIAILSSDDIFALDKLEKQVVFLDQHPDIGAVFSYAQIIDDEGNRFDKKDQFYSDIFNQPNRSRFEWLNHFFFKENCLCHSSILIRRQCYDTIGLYDRRYAQLPDFDYWIRLCMAYDIHILPEELVKFRVRSDGANASGDRPEVHIRHEIELSRILRHYRSPFVREHFALIFPDSAIERSEANPAIAAFLIAMQAAQINRPAYRLFAIDTLYDIFAGDQATIHAIKEQFSFEFADLIRFVAQHDVFQYGSTSRQAAEFRGEIEAHRQAIERLNDALTHKDEAIQGLRGELQAQQRVLDTTQTQLAARNQEVNRLRAQAHANAQALQEIQSIRSSLAYKVLTRVVWPLSSKLPAPLRAGLKRGLRQAKHLLYRGTPADELRSGIEADLAKPFVVGKGNAFYLNGWCYHPQYPIRRLDVLVDGKPHRVVNHSMARPDVLRRHVPQLDETGNSLLSGFWTVLPFQGRAEPYEARLALRATLSNGRVSEAALGTLELLPSQRDPVDADLPALPETDAPLLAICLATYNSPLDLFAIQIDSIINQTYQHWICIIQDDCSDPEIFEEIKRIIARDPRFLVYQNEQRMGFYRNFERCLARVPSAARFVGFADHDDYWYPDKLASCVAAFDEQTMLVYSDMDIVTRDGEPVSHTYWTTRKNNYTDFEVLLWANTVTGAASLFRAELLDDVLPLPSATGQVFHDHWVACIAYIHGKIRYIDRPLYAYRQHHNNIIGHYPRGPKVRWLPRPRLLAQWARALVVPHRDVGDQLLGKRDIYFRFVIRLIILVRTLRLRADDAPAEKRATLDRLADMERSPRVSLLQAFKYTQTRRPSLGLEVYALQGVLGTRIYDLYYRWKRPQLVQTRLAEARRAAGPGGRPQGVGAQEARGPVDYLTRKIAPLNLEVDQQAERCVNLLISTVDFKYLFAGYIGMFNLALHIRRSGYRVRMVIVDECSYNPAAWRRELASYEGLQDLLDEVETAYVYNRSQRLQVSPRDAFIATSWWTAHIAHQAAHALGQAKFVFLAQEYEPMFYPTGSFGALAEQAYRFPHFAVFSTELLRDYFRQHRLGVFHDDLQQGDCASVAIQNAVIPARVDVQDLRRRRHRRLLFYARPEQHAARNMFEMGVLALRGAIESGHFSPGEWELHGIGALSAYKDLKLPRDTHLKLLPKVTMQEYLALLPSYDLGLSLMLSPHPSMTPLDMAAAGLVTVTNTYANKTKEALERISPNIIAVPPTIAGVQDGLVAALDEVDDVEKRVAGARINWSTSWAETFNDEVMAKIKQFLN